MTKYHVLNERMTKFIEVEEHEFTEILWSVVGRGKGYFTSWANNMWNEELANEMVNRFFGEEEEEYITMFTYGILKYPYNIKREGGIDIVENATVTGHKMFTNNWSFPITLETNHIQDIVYGTLFKVPASTVNHQYDYIEGYNLNNHPDQNMYNRKVVTVTTPDLQQTEANMYIANPRMFARYFNSNYAIPTGNFDDKRKFEKLYNKKKYSKGK